MATLEQTLENKIANKITNNALADVKNNEHLCTSFPFTDLENMINRFPDHMATLEQNIGKKLEDKITNTALADFEHLCTSLTHLENKVNHMAAVLAAKSDAVTSSCTMSEETWT